MEVSLETEIFWMNNKTIIEFGLISYDVNNYAELGGC